MSYENVKEWRNSIKNNLVDCLGGQCNKCGYNKCKSALDFHHIDPQTKIYTIAHMLSNPKKSTDVVLEAKKCILLCKNCHSELHAGLWNIDQIKLMQFDDTKLIWKYGDKKHNCPICNRYFRMTNSNIKYCSKNCANIGRRKVERPTRKQLLIDVEQLGYRGAGKKYGVSDNSIKNWLNK